MNADQVTPAETQETRAEVSGQGSVSPSQPPPQPNLATEIRDVSKALRELAALVKAATNPPTVNREKERLAGIRNLARQWGPATAGLTGILGLGGLVFGADALRAVSSSAKAALVTFYVLALAAAAIGSILSAIASYGVPPWPIRRKEAWVSAFDTYDPETGSATHASLALWLGMIASVLAYFFAVLALVIYFVF